MLAVWTDGVAVDEDPGVPARITFPGLTAQCVTGIDALHCLEHKLSFEVDGESTVVSDILVKDYPLMIRQGRSPFRPIHRERGTTDWGQVYSTIHEKEMRRGMRRGDEFLVPKF